VPLVTSNARLARIATFHARSGHADRLLERLLRAAGLVALAFGPHSPGDGEMVTDWSAP
jgi:hypothetical protein